MIQPRNILTIARKLEEEKTTVTIFDVVYPTVRVDAMPEIPRLMLLEAWQRLEDAEQEAEELNAQIRDTGRIPQGLADAGKKVLDVLRDVVRIVVPTLPEDVLHELDSAYLEELTQLFLQMRRGITPGATPTAGETPVREPETPITPKTPTRKPKTPATRRSSAKSASATPATV